MSSREEEQEFLADWWTVTKASAADIQRDIKEATNVFVSQRRDDKLETLTDEQVSQVCKFVRDRHPGSWGHSDRAGLWARP